MSDYRGPRRCRCGHAGGLHQLVSPRGPGLAYLGSCAVSVAGEPRRELPAWSCPCTRYAEGPLVPLAELTRPPRQVAPSTLLPERRRAS